MTEIEKIDTRIASVLDGIEMLTRQFANTNAVVGSMSVEMARIKNVVEDHDEKLKKRVYLSTFHCRMVTKEIRSRVSYICNNYGGLDYSRHAKGLFSAIYNSLYDAYSVTSYRELPEAYYEDILDRIRTWYEPLKLQNLLEAKSA